ncbi:MAG: helix-turn-helix domain-containing protein [Nitrospinaceae bacterium]|jgi:excisionase family DNA binding protein|nr:helix-turn-helix domain-containing protein [Nitrospinaceae bacterium]
METTSEQYLSTKELMALLGISRSTIHRLMEVGLPCLKVGGQNRFPKEEVIEWLKEREEVAGVATAILPEGSYRCISCGLVGNVNKPMSLSNLCCPQCGTQSQVERV